MVATGGYADDSDGTERLWERVNTIIFSPIGLVSILKIIIFSWNTARASTTGVVN